MCEKQNKLFFFWEKVSKYFKIWEFKLSLFLKKCVHKNLVKVAAAVHPQSSYLKLRGKNVSEWPNFGIVYWKPAFLVELAIRYNFFFPPFIFFVFELQKKLASTLEGGCGVVINIVLVCTIIERNSVDDETDDTYAVWCSWMCMYLQYRYCTTSTLIYLPSMKCISLTRYLFFSHSSILFLLCFSFNAHLWIIENLYGLGLGVVDRDSRLKKRVTILSADYVQLYEKGENHVPLRFYCQSCRRSASSYFKGTLYAGTMECLMMMVTYKVLLKC